MLADFPARFGGFVYWVLAPFLCFGASILETLGSILVTLGSPGALFELRASIWSPRAPEVRKRPDFSLTPPPVCLQLGALLPYFCCILDVFPHPFFEPAFWYLPVSSLRAFHFV